LAEVLAISQLAAPICYSAPDRGAEYCGERVCVFFCPRSYPRNYTSDLHQFFESENSEEGGLGILMTGPDQLKEFTVCVLIVLEVLMAVVQSI